MTLTDLAIRLEPRDGTVTVQDLMDVLSQFDATAEVFIESGALTLRPVAIDMPHYHGSDIRYVLIVPEEI